MARSHPPTLLTLARRALKTECALLPGSRLLVAVSGGPDSIALLHVLASLRHEFGYELAAHGVDHGLRAEAAAELALAERVSAELRVPFGRSTLAVAAGGNLQARAREARYLALGEAARQAGGAVIATAHHADDRAETVLLRLLRGTGPAGLAVLPARAGDRVRPLIRARRGDILSHLSRHQLPCAEDPSNRDARFLRVRVRNELMPLLESLSPGIVEHLTALADQLASAKPPPLLNLDGKAVVLGRAQRQLLEILLTRRSRTGHVRLRGGLELRVDPTTGALHLGESADKSSVPPHRRSGGTVA
jgi:tRNA(Ile)-lysidine synthase